MNTFDSKREQIKAAGIKSFAMFGYHKTTLEDIAGMLNMKKNSLYYYFDGKDALFKEIIEDAISEHYVKAEEILKSNGTATEKFNKLIDCLNTFISEKTTTYTVKISSYIEISKVIKQSFPESHEKEIELLSKILKEGIDSGEFKNHDYQTKAKDIADIIPAIFNFHYLNANSEFVKDVDFKPIINQIKRIITDILNGIKNR